MTIYKSAAEEIAENMARFLEKSAGFPIDWEYFKKTVDDARRCEDLQAPWRWIEGGKTATYQSRAFQYFLQKERELKSNFGSNCQTR